MGHPQQPAMFTTALSLALLALTASSSVVVTIDPELPPPGWVPVYACAVDSGPRVLKDVWTQTWTHNTPANCMQLCSLYDYAYAGVEFGKECHCGTGLVDSITAAPRSECNFACSGDANLMCGGASRIQVRCGDGLGSHADR